MKPKRVIEDIRSKYRDYFVKAKVTGNGSNADWYSGVVMGLSVALDEDVTRELELLDALCDLERERLVRATYDPTPYPRNE